MEVVGLLDALKILIEESKSLPIVKKKIIDSDEMLDLIAQIENVLPKEIENAQKIIDQRAKIINEATKEAEAIVKEAERRTIDMIDDHEITRKAQEKSLRIIDEAKIQARELCEEARKYGNYKLQQCEDVLAKLDDDLRQRMLHIDTIYSNLKEDRKLYNSGE